MSYDNLREPWHGPKSPAENGSPNNH